MPIYPALPAAGRIPAFLDPFDFSFQFHSVDALISINGSGQVPPFSYGGAVLTLGGWRGGVLPAVQTPENALFGWSYIRIVPAGFSGTSPMRNFQARIGPRLAIWQVEPGGLPFLT